VVINTCYMDKREDKTSGWDITENQTIKLINNVPFVNICEYLPRQSPLSYIHCAIFTVP
jgi:hypothetical protein